MTGEALKWRVHLHVDKWTPEQTSQALAFYGVRWIEGDALGAIVAPAETLDLPGNLLTTAGLNRLTSLLIGGGGQALTNTACRIGTGNSTTAAAVGQTDLQAAAGSGNRWFQPMDATYPQQSNGVATFKATFGGSDGNYVWAEWGIDIGAPTVTAGNTVNALLLNRKVQAMGEKVSGSTWTVTATVTIS